MFFRPSSGAQNCTYVRHLSDHYCYLWLAADSSNGLTNTWRCMCSFEFLMMDGKTRLKHVDLLTEINKLWNVASCWLYSANISAMQGDMNFKHGQSSWFALHISLQQGSENFLSEFTILSRNFCILKYRSFTGWSYVSLLFSNKILLVEILLKELNKVWRKWVTAAELIISAMM